MKKIFLFFCFSTCISWTLSLNAQPFTYDFACGSTNVPDDGFISTKTNCTFSDDCMRYVRVNVVFVQDGNGGGNFNSTGNPFNDNNLPSDYSGSDYARDLIGEMNRLLENNAAPNICDGWMFRIDPQFIGERIFTTNDINGGVGSGELVYNPEVTIPIGEKTNFRFHLTEARYVANQAYFNKIINKDSPIYQMVFGLDNLGNSLDKVGEYEIYILGNGSTNGGKGSSNNAAFMFSTPSNIAHRGNLSAQLGLHEMGHVLGLKHTWQYGYVCDGTDAECLECSYYKEGETVCLSSYTGKNQCNGEESPVLRCPDNSFPS
ncbi:MAG: hypothetical protein R3E32_00735 [Chitinophagales bacterium]